MTNNVVRPEDILPDGVESVAIDINLVNQKE